MSNGNGITQVCSRLNDMLMEMNRFLDERQKYCSMLLLGHELMEYSISVMILLRELEAEVAQYGLDIPLDRFSVHFVCGLFYDSYDKVRSMFKSEVDAIGRVSREDFFSQAQVEAIIRGSGTMLFGPEHYAQEMKAFNRRISKHCDKEAILLNDIRNEWENVSLVCKRILDVIGAVRINPTVYEAWKADWPYAWACAPLGKETAAPAMPGTRDGVRVEQHIHVRDMHVHGDVMADNAIKYTNYKE